MTEFLKDIFQQVKEKKLSKREAVALIRRHQTESQSVPSSTSPDQPTLLTSGWQATPLLPAAAPANVLVLAQDRGTVARLGKHLPDSEIILIRPGSSFKRGAALEFELRPTSTDDWRQLFQSLQATDSLALLNLWHWSDGVSREPDQFMHPAATLFSMSKALFDLKWRTPVHQLVLFNREIPEPDIEVLVGFAKTLDRENSAFRCRLLGLTQAQWTDGAALALKISSEFAHGRAIEVRYEMGLREVSHWLPVPAGKQSQPIAFREQGVYLITGPGTSWDRYLALHLAERYGAKLAFAGPASLEERCSSLISEVERLGGQAVWFPCVFAEQAEVTQLLEAIKQRWGQLHGVLHHVGPAHDGLITQKSVDAFLAHVRPTVESTRLLDIGLAANPIDFLVLSASILPLAGNAGQSDYATATYFAGAFAAERNRRAARGICGGHTFAIHWPFWAEVEEGVAPAIKDELEQRLGLVSLGTDQGLDALEKALSLGLNCLAVANGDLAQFLGQVHRDEQPVESPVKVQADPLMLLRAAQAFLKKLIVGATKLPEDRLNVSDHFGSYGVDSLIILKLNRILDDLFPGLPKTLFYEYESIEAMAAYFVAHQADRLAAMLGLESTAGGEPDREEAPQEPTQPSIHGEPEGFRSAGYDDDIAIIGVAGRYPQAEDIETFWQNLVTGLDCITDIPDSAWGDHPLLAAHGSLEHGLGCRKGGFIEDADKFDPLFFQMAPRDAAVLDPQARVFLETAWACLEDAGYTPTRLVAKEGHQVGVFVGATAADYQLLSLPRAADGSQLNGLAYLHTIANRVSFHLGIHGPSISVDTACSSSLTAIHLACRSLSQGECATALAGGVNLSLHPNKYQYLSKGNFLSEEGKCRSFGADGAGYVPGEGVGAVLLKPLASARAAGDRIYAVIKGSAVNHGGRTSGFTVPNPNAQAMVIKEALRRANVDPRTLSYVEAHGTGTELGDPIEIAGLSKAFGAWTQDRGFCAIGSSKSNIGHLEAAAGIAQLTKVILQMRHRMLVPSLHCEQPNPNIDFSQSPFYLQRDLSPWRPIRPAGFEGALSRRAAISSFGAGGSNAHLILEEWQDAPVDQVAVQRDTHYVLLSAKNATRLQAYAARLADFLEGRSGQEDVFSFARESAATVLERSVDDLITTQTFEEMGFDAVSLGKWLGCIQARFGDHLTEGIFTTHSDLASLSEHLSAQDPTMDETVNLAAVAYTLQIGREAFPARLALEVADKQEAIRALRGYVAGETPAEQVQPDTVPGNGADVADLMRAKDWRALAARWVGGETVAWSQLYTAPVPKIVSLPTYPFARDRYWLPVGVDEPAVATSQLHPLVHRTQSDFHEQRFSSTFSGTEFFFADHRVMGQPILPGVAYLEMAREAVWRSLGADPHNLHGGLHLRHVVWAKPIAMASAEDTQRDIQIGLYPEEDGSISFDVFAQPSGDEASDIFAQGRAVIGDEPQPEPLDLTALLAQCGEDFWQADDMYGAFSANGIQYGAGHRAVSKVHFGPQRGQDRPEFVLAELALPDAVVHTAPSFQLHPSLMDAAFQAIAGLLATPAHESAQTQVRPAVPFAVEQVRLLDTSLVLRWAHIRPSDSGTQQLSTVDSLEKFDLDLCDDQGRVGLRIHGLSVRTFDGAVAGDSAMVIPDDRRGLLMVSPTWRVDEPQTSANQPITRPKATHSAHHIWCFVAESSDRWSIPSLAGELNAAVSGAEVRIETLPNQRLDQAFSQLSTTLFEWLQNLIQAQVKQESLIQVVLLHEASSDAEPSVLALGSAVAGMIKTARLENPKVLGQLIEVEDALSTQALVQLLGHGAADPACDHLRHQAGQDWRLTWQPVHTSKPLSQLEQASTQPVDLPWRDGGTYWITGGCGGLGRIFAEEIVARVADVHLILSGRSALSPSKTEWIDALRAKTHGTVTYAQVDVTDETSLRSWFETSRAELAGLRGLIHTAGVLRDSFILKKEVDDFTAVLAPKVTGTVLLDQLTQSLDLDFMVYFSSGAATVGNLGQADYATANGFMDRFAARRNQWVVAGKRQGITCSINWPLWREGGMQVDAATERRMVASTGVMAMTTATGLDAFYRSLASEQAQVMVMEGDVARIANQFWAPAEEPSEQGQQELAPRAKTTHSEDLDREPVVAFLAGLLAGVIQLPVDQIEEDAPFEDYGIDSIMVMDLTNQLESVFGSLSKTLFFEYQNLGDLSDYFLAYHASELAGILSKTEDSVSDSPILPETQLSRSRRTRRSGKRFMVTDAQPNAQERGETQNGPLSIAIIGVAGRYPGADNVDEFWQRLRNGDDCVGEIPKDRWDHSPYYDEDPNAVGKTYAKWGGFLDGVDQFDPLFFNVSPRDAEIMDPQGRLFLQCVYETLEDAGYTRQSLAAGRTPQFGRSDLPASVGVFVGVM